MELRTTTRYGSTLGSQFRVLSDWPSSTEAISTFIVRSGETVDILNLSEMEQSYWSDFQNIYSQLLNKPTYRSTDFTITYINSLISLRKNVFLTEAESGSVVLGEPLGDSIYFGVSFRSEHQSIEKPAGGLDVSIKISERIYDDQFEDWLNVVLSPINNYGHWHVHNIPFLEWLYSKAGALLKRQKLKGMRLIFPNLKDSMGAGLKQYFIQRMSEVCNVEASDPDEFHHPVRLRNVVLSSTFHLDMGTNWSRAFQGMFNPFKSPDIVGGPTLLYCNRGHAGRRGIVNEAELESALNRIGFCIVHPGALSYDDQRRIFANAKVIIGSHGGSLTNMVYSHHSPTVIELTHPFYGPVQYTWFRHLASVIGGRHASVVCPVPIAHTGRSYNETFFEVDVPRLTTQVESRILSKLNA